MLDKNEVITHTGMSFNYRIADDVTEWLEDHIEVWDYQRLLVEGDSPLNYHARHVLFVENEDDAFLFKLKWMGQPRRVKGVANFVGPFSEDQAMKPGNTWDMFSQHAH